MAMIISNDTGKAFAKIVNQFLLQTLRVLKKMKSVYQEEQQIFTNDKEKMPFLHNTVFHSNSTID